MWLAALIGALAPGPARAGFSPSSALTEAEKNAKKIRKALDAGAYTEATSLAFSSVAALRREAESSPVSSEDRESLEGAACVTLRLLAELDEQPEKHASLIKIRDELQTPCLPKSVAPAEPTPSPEPTPVKPAEVPAPEPTPAPDVVTPPAEPVKPKSTPLRTAAITTGVLGGVVLASAAVMAGVVARPSAEHECPARGCLAGSYNKAFAAAKASWTDADPNNNVGYGANDRVCDDAARSSNPDVNAACVQRDQLKAGMFTALATGAALGVTALVTGLVHRHRTSTTEAPRFKMGVSPGLGRNWAVSATLHF